MTGNLIKNNDLLIGCFYIFDNAEYFLKIAKSLHEDEKYKASIAISTISIEESLKGFALAREFLKGKDIDKDQWEQIKNHKVKLTKIFEDLIDSLKNKAEDDIAKPRNEFEKNGFHGPRNKEELIKELQEKSNLYSFFKELREACFYVDWNQKSNFWTKFTKSDNTSETLSYFVLSEAEFQLNQLLLKLETIINECRKEGKLLSDVPNLTYREYRNTNDYDSINRLKKYFLKLDEIKKEIGISTFKEFIKSGDIDKASRYLLNNRLKQHLKLLQKQEKSYVHPLIKALLISMSGAEKDKGRIMAMSSDYDSTYNGESTMNFTVIMEKIDQNFHIHNITCFENKDFAYDEATLEKIIRTEEIIERIDGRDIPIEIYIEALSEIGVKAKVIKENEFDTALEWIKNLISTGRFKKNKYMDQKLIDEINSITSSTQLENKDAMVRSMIISAYGMFKYPDYNAHIYPSKKIEKYKARKIIHDVIIHGKYIESA